MANFWIAPILHSATNTVLVFFYILLNVHLNIFILILTNVINEIFIMSLFHASTCFEHMCN